MKGSRGWLWTPTRPTCGPSHGTTRTTARGSPRWCRILRLHGGRRSCQTPSTRRRRSPRSSRRRHARRRRGWCSASASARCSRPRSCPSKRSQGCCAAQDLSAAPSSASRRLSAHAVLCRWPRRLCVTEFRSARSSPSSRRLSRRASTLPRSGGACSVPPPHSRASRARCCSPLPQAPQRHSRSEVAEAAEAEAAVAARSSHRGEQRAARQELGGQPCRVFWAASVGPL
mmetsp:Transcript_9803/g.32123  ORF Transcript_9803/g.32123 Transcript_9803/m.32123 type:complete len:229 (-) Transcript_9803:1013-1699(-)